MKPVHVLPEHDCAPTAVTTSPARGLHAAGWPRRRGGAMVSIQSEPTMFAPTSGPISGSMPPLDQGNTDTCVAFAFSSADLSVRFVFFAS